MTGVMIKKKLKFKQQNKQRKWPLQMIWLDWITIIKLQVSVGTQMVQVLLLHTVKQIIQHGVSIYQYFVFGLFSAEIWITKNLQLL